jgi:hypothetical protein
MTDDTLEHAEGLPSESELVARPPTRTIAFVALGLGILFLLADIVAIALAAGRLWPAATLIAQITLVATGVSFGLGLIAVVLDRGRWIGVAAMIVSVFANPWILLQLFGFLGGS